jgi:hypothetical protein
MKRSRKSKLSLWAWWYDCNLASAYAIVRKKFGNDAQVL